MDMELITFSGLAAEMRKRPVQKGQLIAIDGIAGAGQKTLAGKISELFPCVQIETDHTADAHRLANEIKEKREKTSVVVSGIMMRSLMAEAGLKPDIALYVVPSRKNDRRKFWEGILSKSLPEYLAELTDDLDKRTVEYHWKYHPIIHADYLIEGDL